MATHIRNTGRNKLNLGGNHVAVVGGHDALGAGLVGRGFVESREHGGDCREELRAPRRGA